MSYIDELRKKESEQKHEIEKKKEEHKCAGCVWGRWDGNVRFCMLPKCMKKN